MGRRLLPLECEHGTIIDWGDFGSCQGYCDEYHPNEPCPDFVECSQCVAEKGRLWDDVALLLRAWHCSTGLKRKAGIDPNDVNEAVKRLERRMLSSDSSAA